MCLCSKLSSLFPFMHCTLVTNRKVRWSISFFPRVFGARFISIRTLREGDELPDPPSSQTNKECCHACAKSKVFVKYKHDSLLLGPLRAFNFCSMTEEFQFYFKNSQKQSTDHNINGFYLDGLIFVDRYVPKAVQIGWLLLCIDDKVIGVGVGSTPETSC